MPVTVSSVLLVMRLRCLAATGFRARLMNARSQIGTGAGAMTVVTGQQAPTITAATAPRSACQRNIVAEPS